MCFTEPISWGLTIGGCVVATILFRFDRPGSAYLLLYFALMEFIQALQYEVVDQCDNIWNPILTYLGFMNIAFQPFVANYLSYTYDNKSPWMKIFHFYMMRISFFVGMCWLMRPIIEITGITKSHIPGLCPNASPETIANIYSAAEYLRGDRLCTRSGIRHVRWYIPMADNKYFFPSGYTHGLMWFVPLLVNYEDPKDMIIGLFGYITEAIAGYTTDFHPNETGAT
jgi:hypothetical protein